MNRFISPVFAPRFFLIGALLLAGMNHTPAQTLEKCEPANPGSDHFNFDLSLPLPEQVQTIKLFANGAPLDDRANLDQHAIDDVTSDYVCDVVFLIDQDAGAAASSAQTVTPAVQSFLQRVVNKALATNRNRQLTREQTSKQNGDAAAAKIPALYQIEIATLDGAAYQKLASFGSDEATLAAAIKGVALTTGTQHVARGMQSVLTDLQASAADRKFVVFISTGHFTDPAASLEDMVRAARDAKVKICPVGFNDGQNDDGLNQLAGLSDESQGFALSTERVNAQGEFPLAQEKIDDLLAYMVAGAKGTFDLAGVTRPTTLRFDVTTTFGKTYSVSQKIAAAPAPAPNPAPLPAASTTPAGTPASPTHPAPRAPEPFGSLPWMAENPALAGVAILGVVVVLGLIILAFTRRRPAPVAAVVFPDPPEKDATDFQDSIETDHTTPPADEPALAWLVSGVERHPLGKKPVRIGRKSDNDIVLSDDSVSQYHAEIIHRDGEFLILDRGSSNQVLIAGRPVNRVPLHEGDVIELGEFRLRFTRNLN